MLIVIIAAAAALLLFIFGGFVLGTMRAIDEEEGRYPYPKRMRFYPAAPRRPGADLSSSGFRIWRWLWLWR